MNAPKSHTSRVVKDCYRISNCSLAVEGTRQGCSAWGDGLDCLPCWQFPPPEHRFGSPASEICRECHTVAGIGCRNQYAPILWVTCENGTPLLPDKDGTAPAVRELDGMQDRVQSTYAPFDFGDQLSRLSGGDIQFSQFPPVVGMNEPGAEKDSLAGQATSHKYGRSIV